MVLSSKRWVGKVAIVTGASSGIGAAIVQHLVANGMIVAGLARRVEKLQQLAKTLTGSGKFHAVKTDMSVESDIKNSFKWISDNLGPVHVLVNNAGLIQETTLIAGDTQKWKTTFDTNVLGLCIATREAIEIMKANKIDGHIIHINAITGHKVTYFPNINVYAASKFAVTALTETLRNELRDAGLKIKITSLSPGVVKTEFVNAGGDKPMEKLAGMLTTTPSLQPEDIADGVDYVLSTPPHVQVHELTIKPVGEYF